MGLFEKAGRRFEQFKKQAEEIAEEEAEYGCTACETVLYTDHDDCPECGADSVVALETIGADADDEDADAESGADDHASEDDPESPATDH